MKFITDMMASPNGNIFRVTGHLCGEFTGPGEFPRQRPVTRSFDVYFDLRPNKRLSEQSWGWWFEKQNSNLISLSMIMLYGFQIHWPSIDAVYTESLFVFTGIS